MKKILVINLLALFIIQNMSIIAFAKDVKSNYALSAHAYYKNKDFKSSAQYYEKAYDNTKDNVYKDNAIVAHSNYLMDLVNNEKYDEAVKYCEVILQKYNNNKNIKEVASEVYYSSGVEKFYQGKYKEAKADFNNSMLYGVVEDQRDRAIDSLAKTNQAIKQGLKPKPRTQKTANSIPDAVCAIEVKAYGKTYSDLPILQRVSNLEKDKIGSLYENESLVARVQRLENKIGVNKYARLQSDNYINEIIDQSYGKIHIFSKMPILVYFDPETPDWYKKSYKKTAKEGFEAWCRANKVIQFEYTNNPSLADVKVHWSKEYKDYNWKPQLQTASIEDQHKKNKYKKAGMLVNIGSVATMVVGALVGVPFLGSIGAVGSGVASPYLQYKGLSNNGMQVEISIGSLTLSDLDEEKAKERVKVIAMHQMGHAIGIHAHSSNPNDVMSEQLRATELSQRDINTINEIYKKELEKPDKKDKK